MVLFTLLIPFALLGVVPALGHYEDALLPSVPEAGPEVRERAVPGRVNPAPGESGTRIPEKSVGRCLPGTGQGRREISASDRRHVRGNAVRPFVPYA